MKDLTIATQGVKGGLQKTSKQGRVSVFNGNAELIVVDNFYGSGNNYQQREEPHITIFDGFNPPNEVVMFEGTWSQLVDLLSRAQ